MTSPLQKLLSHYRELAETEREKGDYLERLAVVFIKRDPGMVQEYEDAWSYATWARDHDLPATDTGIDCVAKIRGEDGYCAIQCKFYREGGNIPKVEVDKFLSMRGAMSEYFSRGLIIETTGRAFSANASRLFGGLNVTTIGPDRLEESPIDWTAFDDGKIKLRPPKKLRKHQSEALKDVREGLAKADRGKLIMACGTGKTFTGLKIAEEMVGAGGYVLVLMPTLALMSQTIREWTIDSQTKLRPHAVCSDSQVGERRRSKFDIDKFDIADIELHDLDSPATTNAAKLASKCGDPDVDRMTVVFSTYQSIQTLSEAQKLHGFPEFDLIICDEAHRTTGATLSGEDESNFVRVHDQDFIAGNKRLYMTATPKVFGESVKVKAGEVEAVLASMDDEELYGKTLVARGFGWAIEEGLLTDYKVLVLAVDEGMVSRGVQNLLSDGGTELNLDDATKIVGCYKALIKSGLKEELEGDPQPMQRALAFCKDIASSKLIRDQFSAVVGEYIASNEGLEALGEREPLACGLEHVDGTDGAKKRTQLIDWLKESHGDSACRILSNARCLSEGVDVPALDAILFMHPRKSQVDVVQSVGRVMRIAPGKNMGYVILPIGIPAGVAPEEALNDNERYRVVWQILNALRSHDERLDAKVNQADLGVDISDFIEVIAVSNKLPTRKNPTEESADIGDGADAEDDGSESEDESGGVFQSEFSFDEFAHAIRAKIVQKCGTRDYWENWAGDIAIIAKRHITRITSIVEKPGTPEREAFDSFLAEIRDDLNPEVTAGEAIEMLSQHLITRPVFDALFEDYSFATSNPVSKAMQMVLKALGEHHLEKEAKTLRAFYKSVRRRAAGIDNAEAKQKIVVELYDKFFRNAFPKMTGRLGIVYTPIEVVDFIIHSVDEILRNEFGQSLGSEEVHILDPFTGTGTFITRLLQSGLIEPENLGRKYRYEIHANEIVLLAYYIAAINIEATYHGLAGGDYQSFEGICLTDTFQMSEQSEDLIAEIFPENSDRRTRQRKLPVRVIIGNPPYSVGQKSENDNTKNLEYLKLDQRIRETYAAESDAGLKGSLYDSYIRAIRWASDRIGKSGIVAYVTNAGWLDNKATDGLRKCLVEEFASIHVFHLRGNKLTSGELWQKEKANVFGQGTRTPVAIALLVKNPDAKQKGQIYFHDIGDYLTKEEKLSTITRFGSIGGIASAGGWQKIIPDEHTDWLNQRDKAFDNFIAIGDKRNARCVTIFDNYSQGVTTNRDSWAINSSHNVLAQNMARMVGIYQTELARFNAAYPEADREERAKAVGDFINPDPTKISWTRSIKKDLAKGRKLVFDAACLTPSLYRPFTHQWLYYSRDFNECVYQMPHIFSMRETADNRVICVSGIGANTDFSALMVNSIPNLHTLDTGQCFPRYLFDDLPRNQRMTSQGGLELEEQDADGLRRRDALTDDGLAHFQFAYPGETITKDDLFHYIYGILHSEDYRSRFANNLSKELPRIPAVKKVKDFWAFAEAGRQLGDLHCDYESVDPYPLPIEQGDLLSGGKDPKAYYRVEKMKFHKIRNREGKKEPDKTTVIYNSNITITGIPLEAYDYVVNGKSALDWVIKCQCVKVDKKSGIVNDANSYAIETVGDPAYPLKLFQRVITVSLETMKIVNALPKLEID